MIYSIHVYDDGDIEISTFFTKKLFANPSDQVFNTLDEVISELISWGSRTSEEIEQALLQLKTKDGEAIVVL